MSKINITERKLNLDYLLEQIRVQECRYIIMNQETLNELDEMVNDMFAKIEVEDKYISVRKIILNTPKYATIWDIPIAICEKLKYGEVDIV